MDESSSRGPRVSRRDLLRAAGAMGAAAFVPDPPETAAAVSGVSPGEPEAIVDASLASPSAPSGPLMNLTAQETEILQAMIDRLIPSDELGPGAVEAGALRFIDRTIGEVETGVADAYRAGLAALDEHSRVTWGQPFIELSREDQDSVLEGLEAGTATGQSVAFPGGSSAFFGLVRGHTWQGTFGDPQYGGNIDFAGWDLLRYPGLRMRVTSEDQRRLETGELDPVRRSAYDFGQFQTGSSR